jgi:Raf kinase inhibitor-like YbhB/YbcL family protein
MTFELLSPEFKNGQAIPRKFTCDGSDVSPKLVWKDAPAGTASFVLLVNDPDAPVGDWVHWVIYNIPASLTHLEEGIPAEKVLADGSLQGRNSWHQVRYGGPCPPGGTHRYFFKLFALDRLLKLDAGAERQEVLRAMQGHILAQAQLIGVYTRQK